MRQDFAESGRLIARFTDNFLHEADSLPPLPDIAPGAALGGLQRQLPEEGHPLEAILQDFQEHILPGMAIWNHPGFMAYFNSTTSPASLLAEGLITATNSNCMNWLSCPAGTELEELATDWLRQLLGLPSAFWGIIFEGGSLSNFHALAAAREKVLGAVFRTKGGRAMPPMRAYTTTQAHSSIAKALITLGVGRENIIHIPEGEAFCMQAGALHTQLEEDLQKGIQPMCVIASLGSTSTVAMDPIEDIAAICRQHGIWLHVDAAHAGPVAMLQSHRHLFKGWELADSITVNPHKWMFLSLDTSVLFLREHHYLRQAFSLTPEYLKTEQDELATNYNDYGLTLGRRFKALKLWANIRYFGQNGYAAIIGRHLQMAQQFRAWLEAEPGFELMAPTLLSTLCFRYCPPEQTLEGKALNDYNEALLRCINQTGKLFLSGTRLRSQFIIRLCISGLWVGEEQLKAAWQAIREGTRQLK